MTCGALFLAGILLAGGFIHLLVDSNEQFDDMGGYDWFPWAFAVAGMTIACLACFEIMLDCLIEDYVSSRGRNVREDRNLSLSIRQIPAQMMTNLWKRKCRKLLPAPL